MPTVGNLSQKIAETIDELKGSDIYGCITGSCMLVNECDLDTWDAVPDIDIFVYTPEAFVEAFTELKYRYGFNELTKGEAWKQKRTIEHGLQKSALTTTKLERDGVIVNVSCRKNQHTVLDVISAFDMSIIMRGYDIKTKQLLDMRGDEKWTASPNPYRNQDYDLYTVDQWIRQFDRVKKYWDRGFDTRPMARFYIQMIDGVLDVGSLFDSEKATGLFEEFASNFKECRAKIETWLKDKEDIDE